MMSSAGQTRKTSWRRLCVAEQQREGVLGGRCSLEWNGVENPMRGMVLSTLGGSLCHSRKFTFQR